MAKFQQDRTQVATMLVHKQLSISLDVLLYNYSDIFKPEQGTIVDFKAKLLVNPEMISKFCKIWYVTFAIKGAIEGELKRLEAAGIMESWTHSDWAAPVVAIPKNEADSVSVGTTR